MGDGSSIEGFARIESLTCWPSPTRYFAVLLGVPAPAAGPHVLQIYARRNCRHPRNVLKKVGQGRGRWVHHVRGAERFYFRDSCGTEVLDHGGYFDLTCTLDAGTDLRRDVNALHEFGIRWVLSRWPPRSMRSTSASRTS